MKNFAEVSKSINEISKSISEISKQFMDIPKFAEGINPKEIKDFNEADKKLSKDLKEVDKNVNIEKIKCINEHLEGKEHITGVKFERKIVDDGEGNLKEGVFPQFKSEFDAVLLRDEYKSTDSVQFTSANKQLKEAVANDSDLAKKFTPQQLEMIEAGRTPRGYTWHHSEKLGILQLVDTNIHSKTAHTGGRSIWGGGTENR